MGRPNKGSSLTEKAFDNYSSSDYLAGFENGGSTHKYNIANVSKYALEKQTLSAGGKSGTVKTIIDGLTPRIKKTEDDIAAFETTVAEAEAAVTELSGRVNAMESGPLVAATSSAMVDTTRIYVYTGEELGMTPGNWYYHNGTNWVSGGVYNAVAVNTDDTLSVEDVPADAKAVGDAFSAMDEQKANIDGVYESMTVGNAEQLIGSVFTEDDTPYNFRTSGGAIDIGDREIDKLVGGTVAWNQLLNIDNRSEWRPNTNTVLSYDDTNKVYTVSMTAVGNSIGIYNEYAPEPVDHVFLTFVHVNTPQTATFETGGKQPIVTETDKWIELSAIRRNVRVFTIYVKAAISELSSDYTFQAKNMQCFDLTQMFGSTIADYIYSLEQATAGAGVAFFRKLFPKPYYPYNAGELMSVQTSAHKTVGFNAWDEEWEAGAINVSTGAPVTSDGNYRSKNFIPVIPGTAYCYTNENVSAGIRLCYYDANKNYIGYLSNSNTNPQTFSTPSNAHYLKFYWGDISKACINLSWDGERDGEYEEYKEHVYPLDSNLTLRGIPKLDASNKLYYDGDTYESDGTVRRKYGIVDLGTLAWSRTVSGIFMTNGLADNIKSNSGPYEISSLVAPGYVAITSTITGPQGTNPAPDMTMSVGSGQSKAFFINNLSYTDAADFKTAMSGVYLVYELAEPVEETAAPYQNPQVVDDFGTEEYVDSRTVPIPVGHETKYANNLRAKLEMAPDSPDGSGDYIVRQSNGQNEYVPLVIPKELPNTPSEDGIYHLKVTVVNGAAGLSWESEA